MDQSQPVQKTLPVIPSQGVSQFIVAANVSEFLITCGQGCVGVGTTPDGSTMPVPQVNWLSTLSASPTSVKMLLEQLKFAIESYEKLYGIIPVDPAGKVIDIFKKS